MLNPSYGGLIKWPWWNGAPTYVHVKVCRHVQTADTRLSIRACRACDARNLFRADLSLENVLHWSYIPVFIYCIVAGPHIWFSKAGVQTPNLSRRECVFCYGLFACRPMSDFLKACLIQNCVITSYGNVDLNWIKGIANSFLFSLIFYGGKSI